MLTISGHRKASESKEHIQLIEMMVAHFKKLGYRNIRADLQGYLQPELIGDGRGNNFVPDVTCNKGDYVGTKIILEAETCGTIGDQHAAGQWSAFANAAGEFHLVVPKLCGLASGREKARSRLRELGIAAIEIWTPQ